MSDVGRGKFRTHPVVDIGDDIFTYNSDELGNYASTEASLLGWPPGYWPDRLSLRNSKTGDVLNFVKGAKLLGNKGFEYDMIYDNRRLYGKIIIYND